MAIYALGDLEPRVDPTAYVHPDATVIGDVTLGPGTTVWPQAVLRGDYGIIHVGARTSVQDGAVLHTTPQTPTIVGDDVVIGHLAHLECCTVHDGALIVQGGRLTAAGCVLPLTSNPGVSRTLGTRHRAAIGLTEETDAVVLVVSEEDGTVSLVHQGRMTRDVDPGTLRVTLQRLLLG